MLNFLRVIFLLCAQNVTFRLIFPLSDGVDAFASPSSLQSRNAPTFPQYWSRIRNSNPSAIACISRTTSLYSTKHDRDSKSGNAISSSSSSSSSSINSYCENDENSASSSSATSTTPTPPSTSTNEYSFFDEATIYIRAGSGGQGSSTYKKGINNQNGPPDGGNGGRGGDVILELDESLNTLAGLARYAWRPNSFGGGGGARIRKRGGGGSGGDATSSVSSGGSGSMGRVLTFRAENGTDGGRQCRTGKNGKDVIVRVPPGTVVQQEVLPEKKKRNRDGREDSDDVATMEPTYIDLGTITHANPTLLVATGGQGGEGSALHSTLQRGVRRPRIPPQGGERKRLKLTLKVVADVALVAVPNAGKSTLLSKVTRAKPKIADYPFTTVVPNLGVWVPSNPAAYEDDEEEDEQYTYDENGNPVLSSPKSKSLILCDVPGLIAGASEGIGLGHAFLRHVERCHVILHLLDSTSEDVIGDYAMINRELLNYGTGKLATMPQVVVVNKLDIAFSDEMEVDEVDQDDSSSKKRFRSKAELEAKLREVMPHSRLMWISAKEGEGVDDLMERVAMFVKKVKEINASTE